MARKPARSKPRNDAIVELGDTPAQQPFALTVTDLTTQVFVAAIVSLDAETRKMHSEPRGVSISDFDKLPPRYKKSVIERIKKMRESLRLSATSKQLLRNFFQPQVAGLREEDLSRMRSGVTLAFSDLVANKDPGAIASLAAQLKIDWPPMGAIYLAPNRLEIETLLADHKSRLATARAYIGDLNLAFLMRHDPTPAWKALETEYRVAPLLTLVALDSLDTMSHQEAQVLLKVMADCVVQQEDAQRTRLAKQLAPLEKNRATGALRNKQRAAEAHAQLRQIAWNLYEGNPAWGVKDVVQRIYNTAGQIQGRTYSAATIRRVIKGVRQEWRKDFEAKRKKTGLYTLDR